MMTLNDLKDAVQEMVTKAEEAGLDPDSIPVIGLNMHGEFRRDYVSVEARFEAEDPNEHFDPDLWGPGEPCVGVQTED